MKKITRIIVMLAAAILVPTLASTAVTTGKKAKEETKQATETKSSAPRQFTAQAQLSIGIPVQAIVVASSAEQSGAQAALSAALARAETLDRELFSEGGVESQINALKPGEKLVLSQDGFDLISRSIKLATQTGGWFDITSPSSKNWFTKRDWRRISLDKDARTVSFKSDQMSLDLRRIAAGFIVDMMMDEITKSGYANVMITAGSVQRNAGRDIFTPWNITIGFGEEGPSQAAHRAYRYDITNVAAATVTKDGLANGLIDPRNKKPVVDAGIRSLTILAADATTATAYALAAYTVGPKFGLQFVEAHPETRGIMVDNGGNLLASRGLSIVTAQERQDLPESATTGGSNDLRQKQSEENLEK